MRKIDLEPTMVWLRWFSWGTMAGALPGIITSILRQINQLAGFSEFSMFVASFCTLGGVAYLYQGFQPEIKVRCAHYPLVTFTGITIGAGGAILSYAKYGVLATIGFFLCGQVVCLIAFLKWRKKANALQRLLKDSGDKNDKK